MSKQDFQIIRNLIIFFLTSITITLSIISYVENNKKISDREMSNIRGLLEDDKEYYGPIIHEATQNDKVTCYEYKQIIKAEELKTIRDLHKDSKPSEFLIKGI